ncbi:hypothetical protein DFJ73DRAFT_817836 [Zopfochytrium polystomum]|nr:hypothetical protein DFJ73DRAFT_817836 [Zopfochytrium polystomum]
MNFVKPPRSSPQAGHVVLDRSGREPPESDERPSTEGTHLVALSGSYIAVTHGSPRTGKRSLLDLNGVALIIFILLGIFYMQIRSEVPEDGDQDGDPWDPKFDFEPPLQCRPMEATEKAFKPQVSIPKSINSVTLSVTGAGVGTVLLEVDPNVTSIVVDIHFHYTPNLQPDLNFESIIKSEAHLIIKTPTCLRCSGNKPIQHPKMTDRSPTVERFSGGGTYYNKDGCVLVAARIRFPPAIALPNIVVTTESMSIHVTLGDGHTKVQSLRLSSTSGDIKVTGLTTPSLIVEATNGDVVITNVQADELKVDAENGEVAITNAQTDDSRLTAKNGGIKMKIFTGRSLKSTIMAGSIKGEDLVIDSDASLNTDAGTVSLKKVSGTFKSLGAIVGTGDLSITNLGMNTTTRSIITVSVNAGFIQMSVADFHGNFQITSANGKVAATGDVIQNKQKNAITGRTKGEENMHGLYAMTNHGDATVDFLRPT